jgi:2-polyprenyl-6-methoxyphenol hydroxylase-like FAD-dependent oxidoreductase
MQAEFDVLIVGAGPAGSSAAVLLARAGWSVALVEKQRFPRRKVCGECIAASNLPLLHALGIGPAFDAAAGPELRRVALMCGERAVETDLPAADHGPHHWGRALGRETLDGLLLEQARVSGAVVLQPWSVQALRGGAGHWRCELRALESQATRTLHARLAIDAHGSWEVLQSDRSRVRPTRRVGDLFAFKANFRQASLRQGLLPVLCLDGGYGGMVLADGGLCTLACCIRSDRLDTLRRASPGVRAGEVVEAWLTDECAGVREALHSATRVGPWLAAGPIAPGVRLRADDTLFRIGNAAGEAHPIIGEGMSMALQSAWLLCSQLLAADRGVALADVAWQRGAGRAYAASWRRQFAPRLRLAAAFAQLAMRPGLAAPLLSLAQSWPRLLTLGATWGGKVQCAVDSAALALQPPCAPTPNRADLPSPSHATSAFATHPRQA